MAAAYAALVSLFNNLELIQTHPRHSFSFENKQIHSLLQIVCFLIGFMEADDYHGGSKEAAEVLERQIASAAHAAEDVIESHVVDQIQSGSTLDGKKRSVYLYDVQKVIEDMELVRRKTIKVQDARSGFKAEQPTLSAATSSTPPISDKDKIVGFDDVLLQLLDLLTGYPSSRRVIPIVGTGGIGKTTLAKLAFQHPLIVESFVVCRWVTISQQYVVTDILSTLLSRHGESNSETVDELGVQLRRSLYGRRYLIVLDDMWSVEAWDEIKYFFPDTNSGSRIIVTSRQSDVANHFGSLSFAMSLLDKDKSWDLFCQKAFVEQSCSLELEEIGKKIVEKCGGLPLAIVVAGGHLRMSPRTQEYWENHMKSILNLGQNDNHLFDILYLSYSYLPVHLKPCFLYMGVFQEDCVVSVSYLMHLWIAEGFLMPKDGQTLEEVAEGYLNDLIGRNLILVADQIHWRFKWKTKECVIHDALREMCRTIAQKEKLFCVLDTSRSIYGERRVVINERNVEEMQHVPRSAPFLRSQITREGCDVSFDSKLLRVMTTTEWTEKMVSIHKSVNLRFLGRLYVRLNSSISLLWNLQTLIVDGGGESVLAPYEIWEMTQLRYLYVDNVFLPSDELDKANDMVLQNLQTLGYAIHFRLSDEVCNKIPNIKELEMTYSDSFMECDEPWSYCPQNLGHLHKLELLHCTLNTGPKWLEFARALSFPSSLKKLILWWVHLDWEEITTKIGSLPLLEVVELEYVEGGAEWNPVEGGFPRLRSFHIRYCDDLTNWDAERWHFRVLEHLSLFNLTKLDELPSGIGEIPTLERIHLRGCKESLAISALRIVVEQKENGNDSLQLCVDFWDNENLESFNKVVQEEGLTSNNLHLSLTRTL